MHNVTETSITQLRNATLGERRNTHSQVSKYQLISQPELCYNVTGNVRSDIHSFLRSNADIFNATDRQRRRSLSLKPVKASSALGYRQCALGAHRLYIYI